MRAQGSGHILPVSSLGGVVALPMFFRETKFAVEGIAEALATEIADLGIHVTIIEPGGFETGFFMEPRNSLTQSLHTIGCESGRIHS